MPNVQTQAHVGTTGRLHDLGADRWGGDVGEGQWLQHHIDTPGAEAIGHTREPRRGVVESALVVTDHLQSAGPVTLGQHRGDVFEGVRFRLEHAQGLKLADPHA